MGPAMRGVLLAAVLAVAAAAADTSGTWRLLAHGIVVVNASLTEDNKFRGRAPQDSVESHDPHDSCHFDVRVTWANDVGSGVIAAPVVVPDPERAGKHIITASYHQYVEVLDGEDGHPSPGWPFAFDHQEFVASPIWVDWDGDRTLDIVAVSKDGYVFFFDLHGNLHADRSMRLPSLPVLRDWYEGLNHSDIMATFSLSDRQPDAGADKVDPSFDKVDWNIPEENFADDLFAEQDDGMPADHAAPPRARAFRQGSSNYIEIDPHVLATPIVADLDGDGFPEVVFAVSYYFDRNTYSSERVMDAMGVSIDTSMYVASGVVVYDTRTQRIRLSKQLDLTTDRAQYRAYMVSSPTIGDVDRDGRPDIIVASTVGYVYAFSLDGDVLDGFPLMMDQVVTQPVLIDVKQDGKQAIIAADRSGNLVAFDLAGNEIWETRFAGMAPEALAIGDVDRDGVVDIVFATSKGLLYAVAGATGAALPGFPLRLGTEVLAPATLVQLTAGSQLAIVVPGANGHVYIVDPQATCVESIDLGEQVFARIVADDVDDNGLLDLVVATMAGNVYCLGTETPYSPLRASLPAFLSPVAYTADYFGVAVSAATRRIRHVTGTSFPVELEIVDHRPARAVPGYYASYRIRFLLGGTVVLHDVTLNEPGFHRLMVPAPDYLVRPTVLVVELENELHEVVVDSFPVAFHVYFYRLLKWVAVLPFFAMSATLFVALRSGSKLLPL